MRISTLSALVFPVLASARVRRLHSKPALVLSLPSIPIATATSVLSSTSTVLNGENLEARQGAVPVGAAPVATHTASTSTTTSATTLSVSSVSSISSKTTTLAAVPLVTTIATPAASESLAGEDSVTVEWVETYIGTVQTWVPITVTVHFAAIPTQGAEPGKGVVGIGTLTGETGKTKTVVAGAAPTLGFGWIGAVAVAGVGLMVG